MKLKLFAAAVLALSAAPALAADLPQREAPPPVKAAVAIPYMYDWSGFYIGGNGGYGWARNCWGDWGGLGIADGCSSRGGGAIGLQGGYRWQMGQVVFGVEAMGDWTSIRGTVPSSLAAVPYGTDNSKVKDLALFTGQIGYAWNNALLYVKGGAAMTSNSFWVADVNNTGLGYWSSTRWGGTVGAGFEYGFAPNWSAGLEWDYLFMGNANNSFSCGAGCAAIANSVSQNVNLLTVRVNYRFGGPVVARY